MHSRHMRQPLSSPMAGRPPQAPVPQVPQGSLAGFVADWATAPAPAAIACGVHTTGDRPSGCGVSANPVADTASLLVSRGVCRGVAGMRISRAQASEDSPSNATCGSCGEAASLGNSCGRLARRVMSCPTAQSVSSSSSLFRNVGQRGDLACSGDGRVAIFEEPGQSGVEVPSPAELEAEGDAASGASGSGRIAADAPARCGCMGIVGTTV